MKASVNLIYFIFVFALMIACKKETSCEGCATKDNKLPIAAAGSDQIITLPTDSVLLDGSNSTDPDGKITAWLWTKISGPTPSNIINESDSITKVKALVSGTYLFELIVTDNGGLSAKDTMRVIVDSLLTINHPPIANAGADQTITLPTNSINLDGSASTDPENNITSYLWTKISGPASFNIVNPSAVQTQLTALSQGTYQFELLVTDAGGLFSRDTINITINLSVTQSPTGDAGPDIIITLPLDSVYLSGTTPVFPPTTFLWTKISGPPQLTFLNSTSSIAFAKDLVPGIYTFRLEINSGGVLIADTMNVIVIDDPQDLNTITFKNLKWRLADEYGTGIIDLDVFTPAQPNLFIAWDQLRPVEIYLQLDSTSQWFIVPASQSGYLYAYDGASPHIWIARIPTDSSWVGKESSVKIKIL